MRVIGIEIAGSEIRWAILDGDNKTGSIDGVEPPKLTLPVSGSDEADNLITLRDQVRTALTAKKPDSVAIIRADKGTSVMRAKMECIVQLAAKEAKVPCKLISPLTVDAAKKRKIQNVTGTTFEGAYGKPQFSYLIPALYCAWSVLNGS